MSSADVAVAAANTSLPGAVALGEEDTARFCEFLSSAGYLLGMLNILCFGMIIIGVLASPVRWWLHNRRVKSARSAEYDLQVSPSLLATPF